MPPLNRPPTIYDHLGPITARKPIPLVNPIPAPYPTANFAGPSPYPSNFNPEQDCEILHKAVHGVGTDERAIINIIVNRNWAQRAEIRNCYKSCFGKDLIKRLKEDTSGNFKEVVAGMFMTPAEFDAMCLYKAMKGAGTKEGVLIEIIGTRTNQELMAVKDAFQREYHESLEKWIKGDTSGNFRNLLIALLQCNRSMNPNPDPNMCQNDAQTLYNAGEGRWGTDESTFIRIFATRSAAEMAMINDCYTRLRGKGLLKAIDKEFSGDIKRLLETVVGGLLDPAGYFAKRIRESVKGLGTCDSKLVRVIVSRSEIDLGRIKQAYQTIYGRDMLHDVRDDTSGYYREILTGLISRC
ncbi:MAG: annexin [Acholeplasmatales bacterium]|nr:annexin [Acholeplasmatales bacterium]